MKFNKSLLASLILGLSSLTTAKVFEAIGYGDTPEEAKKDAVTNAVKFSVGEFVVNREELDNETFSQSIVSHSNAYVKSIEVKSQKKDGDQYVVDVAVDIESQKLIDAVKAQQAATANNVVSKELLSQFSDHLDKKSVNENLKKDFGNLVHELLVKPYLEAKNPPVNIEIIGKLRSGKVIDDKNDKFPVVLSIKLKSNDSYIKTIKRIIKELENEDGTDIRISDGFIKNGDIRVNEAPEFYKVDIDRLNIFLRVMDTENASIFDKYYKDKIPYLTFLFLNKDGDIIKEFRAGYYKHTYDNLYTNNLVGNKDTTYIENLDKVGRISSDRFRSLFSEDTYWGFFSRTGRILGLYNIDLVLDHVMYVTKSELEELKDIKVMFK